MWYITYGNFSQRYLLKVIVHKNKQYPTENLFQEVDVFDIDLLYSLLS